MRIQDFLQFGLVAVSVLSLVACSTDLTLAPSVATNTLVLKVKVSTNSGPIGRFTGVSKSWPVTLALGTLDTSGTNFTPLLTSTWYQGSDFNLSNSSYLSLPVSTSLVFACIPYSSNLNATNTAYPFIGTNLLTNALRLSNGTRAFFLAGPFSCNSNRAYSFQLNYGATATTGDFGAWTNGDAYGTQSVDY